MKKISIYLVLVIVSVSIFILQFSSARSLKPLNYFMVYLDNEKIGVIKSKSEFEKYISSQGEVVKKQVEKYNVDVDRINAFKDIRSKVNDYNYKKVYNQVVAHENVYKNLLKYLDADGKITGDKDKFIKYYDTLNEDLKSVAYVKDDKLIGYDDLVKKINDYIKDNDKVMLEYINKYKEKLNLTSSEKSNLDYFNSNELYNIDYSVYVYQKDYVDKFSIYLYTDDIYEPLGINIKKITTYKKEELSVEDVYSKIIEKKPCTIEGYSFKIKKTKDFYVSDKTLLGSLGSTDYSIVSKNITEDIIIYVTSPEVFDTAVEEFISVFAGTDVYEAYKNKSQKEIKDTGTKIDNVYIKEDISMKKTNVPVSEKIYSDSSSLASYLLYGDTIKTSTVYASSDDTVVGLAYKNGISVEEFFLSNPSFTSVNNIFYDNQPIIITKIEPKISVMIEETQIENRDIDYKVVEKYDSSMIKGDTKVEQNGKKGLMKVHQNVVKENGSIVYAVPVSNETLSKATDKIVLVGTKEIPNVGSTSSWGWPTPSGYTINSYFGYRSNPFGGGGRVFHSAIDIGGIGYGANVYASNNGTIVERGWHYSYGNHIIIDHNNGYWTLYAHMQSFKSGLSVGSVVSRGQVIGFVGSTGASTGPHLHFELRVGSNSYSNVVDPLPYLRR